MIFFDSFILLSIFLSKYAVKVKINICTIHINNYSHFNFCKYYPTRVTYEETFLEIMLYYCAGVGTLPLIKFPRLTHVISNCEPGLQIDNFKDI